MTGFLPIGGGGTGSGFQLFTQSNNDSGIYADAAARDVYFGANPDELARLDDNEFLIIKLLDDGGGNVAYQQRASAAWVDVTSLVQGETGPAGATGNSYFFASIAKRDAFFNTVGNEALLEQGLPIEVNTDNTITPFTWNGGDTPVSYDETLWRTASIRTSPGTVFLGTGGTSVSNGLNVLNFVNAKDQLSYGVVVTYNNAGSNAVSVPTLAARQTVSRADVFDSLLADPQDMVLSTGTSAMNRAFTIRPGTTGELRIQGWAGAVDTASSVIDQLITVEVGDIGNTLLIELNNPIFIGLPDDVLLRFSGVQLNGGLQTSGDFNGQTVPYLDADTQSGAAANVAQPADPRTFYFAKGGDNALDGTTLENANLDIQESIDKVNALIPAPDSANPSTILCLGAGSFSENIVLPEGCRLYAPNVRITAASGTAVTMSSDTSIVVDGVVASGASGNCFLLNDVDTASIKSRRVTCVGSSSNGFSIQGDTKNVFASAEKITCSGISSAGVFDGSSSFGTRIYNVDQILLGNTNTLGIFFDPADLAASGVFNVGAINEAPGASTTQGIRIDGGFALVVVNDLEADTPVIINTGGNLNCTANRIIGAINVNGSGVMNAQVIEHQGGFNPAITSTVTGRLGSTEFSDQDIEGSLTASGIIEAGL